MTASPRLLRRATRHLAALLLLLTGAFAVAAEDDARRAQLHRQLDAFLAGATVNDAHVHDAFWAEELVYTSSRGTRFGKAELMRGVRESGPVAAEDVDAVYSARDAQVRLFGDLALLDFVLVAAEEDGSEALYLNSGTFLWRDGRWQALAWQATARADAE